MCFKTDLTVKAINKVKQNQKHWSLTDSDRKFIDKFDVQDNSFIFHELGIKRCTCDEKSLPCYHRNGLIFFPKKTTELTQKIQNRLFLMAGKIKVSTVTVEV
jgi:hypothetical protein